MNAKIIPILVMAGAITSLSLAQSADSSPQSPIVPPVTVQELHAELRKTQMELQQAVARVTQLEQRVDLLEQSNAKLKEEIKNFKEYRVVPLEGK